MDATWTEQRVVALAPDDASVKAGRVLANGRKWPMSGHAGRHLWGECQGSGKKPYQVRIDLEDGASKCSCPSRKFPCKHALGLLLMHASAQVHVGSAPDWVTEWAEDRARREEKKAQKAEAPPAPVDAEAQARRRAKRMEKVGGGLVALAAWLEDMMRGGIATLPGQGFAYFDEMARRMIDAQAPGVARRVRLLGSLANSGGTWQRPFLDEVGRLHLLIEAHARLDDLPEQLRTRVLDTIGLPGSIDASDVAQDTWQVIGQELEEEDRLRVQRTFLFGVNSRRPALVLAFAHGGAVLDASLGVGTCFEGELAFYPGDGLRAEVRGRAEVRPIQQLVGFDTLDALCAATSNLRADHPWRAASAAPVAGLTPLSRGDTWQLRDRVGATLPAALNASDPWRLMALSGGHPIDVVVKLDGATLRPLGALADRWTTFTFAG